MKPARATPNASPESVRRPDLSAVLNPSFTGCQRVPRTCPAQIAAIAAKCVRSKNDEVGRDEAQAGQRGADGPVAQALATHEVAMEWLGTLLTQQLVDALGERIPLAAHATNCLRASAVEVGSAR